MKNSIKKNYFYNLIYQILIIFFPIVTAPYLSRVLGAENIGIFSYTISITTYFILFGSLGIAMYAQREIAYMQDEKIKRSKTFYEILIMKCITLGIALLLFCFSFVKYSEYSIYYKILIVEIIANILDISWFFQGLEEFKKTVLKNIVIKILSVIFVFLLIKTKNDLYMYFVIYAFSTLLGNLSLWTYLPKYIEKIKIKELRIFKHLKPTIALFIPQIAVQIYTVLDKTMIGNILNDMSEVGVYEQSQRIIRFSMKLVTALGIVVAPRIANSVANNKKEDIIKYLSNSFTFVWFLGVPIMFGIMAIANNFIPWFLGEGFEKAKILLMIGSMLVLAIGLNSITGVQYLIQTKNQRVYTKSVIIGAILNVIFNLILIPTLKSVGAIISSVLAEIIILFVQLLYIKREIPLKIVYKNTTKYLVSGIVMFIITFLMGTIMNPSIINTLIQIISGTVVYFLFLILLKDEFFLNTLSTFKNQLINKKNGRS